MPTHDLLEAGQRDHVFVVLELRLHLHSFLNSELELLIHFSILCLDLLHLLLQVAVLLNLSAHSLVILCHDLFKPVVCEI